MFSRNTPTQIRDTYHLPMRLKPVRAVSPVMMVYRAISTFTQNCIRAAGMSRPMKAAPYLAVR